MSEEITAADAGGSGGTSHSHAFFAGRVANKIKCNLDDVVFGQSLGEGKSYFHVIKHLLYLDRCIWKCQGLLAPWTTSKQVRDEDNEEGGNNKEQACRPHRKREEDSREDRAPVHRKIIVY